MHWPFDHNSKHLLAGWLICDHAIDMLPWPHPHAMPAQHWCMRSHRQLVSFHSTLIRGGVAVGSQLVVSCACHHHLRTTSSTPTRRVIGSAITSYDHFASNMLLLNTVMRSAGWPLLAQQPAFTLVVFHDQHTLDTDFPGVQQFSKVHIGRDGSAIGRSDERRPPVERCPFRACSGSFQCCESGRSQQQ